MVGQKSFLEKLVIMFGNIFNNKKILITGDTGFKGSWLALWLLSLRAEVYGYALPPKKKEDNYFVEVFLNTFKLFIQSMKSLHPITDNSSNLFKLSMCFMCSL